VSSVATEVKQDVSSGLTRADEFVSSETAKVGAAVTSVENKVSSAASSVKASVSSAVSSFKPVLSNPTPSLDGLKTLWNSPNKGAAISTDYELGKLKLTQTGGLSRITPEMQQALSDGVATARSSDGDRGQKGILGKDQAVDAGKTLIGMDQGSYDQLKGLLDNAGKDASGNLKPGADPAAEKALILKAVAARKDQLTDPAKADDAMKEIDAFAKDIRGQNRKDLINSTTVIDIDGAKNDDGIKQGMDNTCAPTVGQMTRAETDPVYARQLNKQGIDGNDPNSQTVKDENWVFTHTADQTDNPHLPVAKGSLDGQKTVDDTLTASLNQQIAYNKYQANPQGIPPPTPNVFFDKNETMALSNYVHGKDLSPAEAKALDSAKAKIGQQNPQLTPEFLDKLATTAKSEDGSSEQSALALTGNQGLNQHAVGDSKGDVDSALKSIRERLSGGNAVPISVAYPKSNTGHAMMISDYRSDKGYLVSDPYSGKTAWVPESQIKDGSWTNGSPFNLNSTSRLDGFYAP
jgi:hypothetical protein